ncbi:MAG: ribonuclease HII [Novosphingobium sp.]|nr:ribonuclease HII [Novosphingobium sp.]
MDPSTPVPSFRAKDLAAGPVVGVDEAGRGPLAGPVVAAAVVLCKPRPAGLDDSKKLSRDQRAVLEDRIKRRCRWAVGVVDVDDIDRLNIFGATMLAMTLAVAALCRDLAEEPAEVLVDGNLTPHGRRPEWRWPARPIVGGDALEPCISAASIIAKEHRDRIMRAHARDYPHYGWETNVGYGTPEHLSALRRHGPTPLHRKHFAPVAQLEMFGKPEIARTLRQAEDERVLIP